MVQEKARINSLLISGGWPFPMGSGAQRPASGPRAFWRVLGSKTRRKTTSGLEQLTGSGRTLRQVRKVPYLDIRHDSVTRSIRTMFSAHSVGGEGGRLFKDAQCATAARLRRLPFGDLMARIARAV